MSKPATIAGEKVKAKKRCCKDRPRCKRCPVVLKRLELAGLATRLDERTWQVDPALSKKQLKVFRARKAHAPA